MNTPQDGIHSASVETSASCHPHRNIVYIKTAKCGSATVSNVLHRYGVRHNLNPMFPCKVKGYYHIGWPNLLELKHVYLYNDKQINLVANHIVFNEPLLTGLMPNDTIYLASIRHPLSQMKSAMNFFGIREYYGLTKNDTVEEFLKNIEKYEKPFKFSQNTAYPGDLTITKNLMAHDFGFPSKFSDNRAYIETWVDKVSKKFTPIVLEYFNESMVLLKRKLCMSHIDIIYSARNTRKYKLKHQPVSAKAKMTHEQHSKVDYALFKAMNDSLWRLISEQTSDFEEEVEYFRLILADTMDFCSGSSTSQTKTFPKSKWGEGFVLDNFFCEQIQLSCDAISDVLWKQLDFSRMYCQEEL